MVGDKEAPVPVNAYWIVATLLGVLAIERAFAADAAAVTPGWSVLTIGALCAGIVGIISSVAVAAVKIITALQETRRILITGQAAATAVGVVAAAKQQEIHLLVNNRFMTALRMLVTVTKKQAERTGTTEDKLMAEHAEAELQDAEASAILVARLQTGNADAERASVATTEHTAALARVGLLPSAHNQLILAQETLVTLTRQNAERTQSDMDRLLYRQAQDNLALSKQLQ